MGSCNTVCSAEWWPVNNRSAAAYIEESITAYSFENVRVWIQRCLEKLVKGLDVVCLWQNISARRVVSLASGIAHIHVDWLYGD